ncbi:unnamed protein product [Didymodactylos carnosus]|uniref:Homeobox domain-containing protein n=1 Tax=Didymodactylos carnosus TaxID=1234261 RepID=A0A814NMT0_9BILA|nr:unnamed protein product [Didymodactylos carnosus]CAF3860650.1 unnamed protein product [Didymodactylos carnosus]
MESQSDCFDPHFSTNPCYLSSSSSSGYQTSMNSSNSSSFNYPYISSNPYLSSTPTSSHFNNSFPTSPVICMYDNSTNIYSSNLVIESPSCNYPQNLSISRSFSPCPRSYPSYYTSPSSPSLSPSTTPNPIVFPSSNVIQLPDYFAPPYPLLTSTSSYSDDIPDHSVLSQLIPPTGRRRRQRTNYSKEQIRELEKVFQTRQYPDVNDREDLSKRLDISESRIQVWFKNRRSRSRMTRCTEGKRNIDQNDTHN